MVSSRERAFWIFLSYNIRSLSGSLENVGRVGTEPSQNVLTLHKTLRVSRVWAVPHFWVLVGLS